MQTTQTPQPPQTTQTITLTLSVAEVNLVLEGLGNMPFVRVFTLVDTIQRQSRQQIAAVDGERTGDTPAPSHAAFSASR